MGTTAVGRLLIHSGWEEVSSADEASTVRGPGVVRGLGVRWLESSMSLPGFFLPVHNQVRTCKCQVLEVTLEQEHAWSQGVYFCLGAIPEDLISGAAPLARAVWEAGEQAWSG